VADKQSKETSVDYSSVEARRSANTDRKMSPGRRLFYFLGLPVFRFLIKLMVGTYRIEAVIGEKHIEPYIADGAICTPCYWHQQHVVCSTLIRKWIDRGFKACFLISASVDGEVPERTARAWGAEVIRGSANKRSQSGTLAMRDMHQMMKRGYSIVTTADGPQGPIYEFKQGAVLTSRIGNAPIIPMACAASSAWYLDRWDMFMIPKPFARVVIAIGPAYEVSRDARLDTLDEHRLNVQERVMSLMRECEERLQA
jgi:lysophospholipid acyltransferase (LPLAT)-like uncharacterized protein